MTALESKALGIALEKLNLTDLPPRLSHLQIEAWRRSEQWLTQRIAEFTKERDELRERLQNVEQ